MVVVVAEQDLLVRPGAELEVQELVAVAVQAKAVLAEVVGQAWPLLVIRALKKPLVVI